MSKSLLILVFLTLATLSTAIPLSDVQTTTLEPNLNETVIVNLQKAAELVSKLNQEVVERLAEDSSKDLEAENIAVVGGFVTVASIHYSGSINTVPGTESPSLVQSLPSESRGQAASTARPQIQGPQLDYQAKDGKFSSVLRDLEDLESHVQDAIRNFTASRQFAYSAMLRPMVRHIRELRENLTQLRNRMISVAALTSISTQVTALQNEIGDAIPGVPINTQRPPNVSAVIGAAVVAASPDGAGANSPVVMRPASGGGKGNVLDANVYNLGSNDTLLNAEAVEEELKELSESFGWVTE